MRSALFVRPVWLRRFALVNTVLFVWTFLLSLPLQALAQQPVSPSPITPKTHRKPRPVPPPKSLLENARPLTEAQAKQLRALSALRKPAPSLTLLNEIGRLTRPVILIR